MRLNCGLSFSLLVPLTTSTNSWQTVQPNLAVRSRSCAAWFSVSCFPVETRV